MCEVSYSVKQKEKRGIIERKITHKRYKDQTEEINMEEDLCQE